MKTSVQNRFCDIISHRSIRHNCMIYSNITMEIPSNPGASDPQQLLRRFIVQGFNVLSEVGEMMMVPYEHRLEPIDEQLVQLIAERFKLTQGANGYPTEELVDRWCQQYDIDRNVILSVFAAMNNPRRPPLHPASPQHLLNIVPVMQKVTVDDVKYQITRIEQYADFSLVYVEIYTDDESETANLNVHLMLNIEPKGDWHVQFYRSQGRTNHTSVVYMVSPRLSDDLSSFKFHLVPYPRPHRQSPPERVLDQLVIFDSHI
jgi:hypothetical protein